MGPNSLLSNIRTIAEDLLRELPYTEYRVAMILHPYIWAAHGEWQIKTWFKKELYAGLNIVPHEIGWEAAIIAADIVIGDYGSVTNYGASIGKPVLRYEPSEDSVPKGIAIAEHANINSIPIKNSYKALTVIRALEATITNKSLGANSFCKRWTLIRIDSTLGIFDTRNKGW